MRYRAERARAPLAGRIRVPGDKSLSHRAVLFAAMARGESHLSGVLDSADVRSTIGAVAALGAGIDLAVHADGSLAGSVRGWGDKGPRAPGSAIDCGNSGTTARLLLGILAGQTELGEATLVGDASLSTRPMRRITDPLSSMGADLTDTDGCLPVTVRGSSLEGIDFDSPVASAQVKSAILLAGTTAAGRTTVTEPAPSRDHTERLLPEFGVAVGRDPETCSAWVEGPTVLAPARVDVPGDPSSAAFMTVAAVIVSGSEIRIDNVALNPTRTGFLAVLQRMGADVTIDRGGGVSGSEDVGAIIARATPDLVATTVTAEEVPSLVDEIPILAVAAACAAGTTRFLGVAELRVKESDRLAAIETALSSAGVRVRAQHDVLEIEGHGGAAGEIPVFADAIVDSLGDHRLAMAWSVAGLASAGSIVIDRFEAVDVSYPGFLEDLASLGAG